MCGIVGLYLKKSELQIQLGKLFKPMLVEMSSRGPDSAGVAIYRNQVKAGQTKFSLAHTDPGFSWKKLGTTAGAYDDWHEGQDPAGISTQDPELSNRLDPVLAGRKLSNYLKVMTLEVQTITRACGKSHVLNLEPEDLVALTVEAAAIAQVPLCGTDWIPGKN